MSSFPSGRLLPLALACCFLLAVVAAGWVYLERDASGRLRPAEARRRREAAPDFTLRRRRRFVPPLDAVCAAGRSLQLGTATCVECVLGHFERKEELDAGVFGQAQFVFVYCREANPGLAVGAMAIKSGPVPGQTFTWDQRQRRLVPQGDGRLAGAC